jgi:methyl-accepting chemotaxis protein
MNSNLRELVGQLQRSAELVNDNARRLESGSSLAGAGVRDVTQAVAGVADGAEDTSRSADETMQAMMQLGHR